MLGCTRTSNIKRTGTRFHCTLRLVFCQNQLALEGPSCVAPVVIPARAPNLDNSLQEDRTLCPVRALCDYLDKTKNLRKGKDLVFVTSRKSFSKDIVLATISSRIKQTVQLCYQLPDEDTQKLLPPPRPFREGSLWTRYSQPVIGRHIIPLPNSI